MASEQLMRDNITNLREIPAEDDGRVVSGRRLDDTSADKIHGGSAAADVHGHPGAIHINPAQAQPRKATAQHKSLDEALRVAEERYEKAKESEREALNKAAEKAKRAAQVSSEYAAKKKDEREKQAAAKKEDKEEIEVYYDDDDVVEEQVGGAFQAVGETIVEIGQTAQDLIAGAGSAAAARDRKK